MSIAIIIGTHGAAAEQLLKTAEMILGEQSNVAYIDFVPGENAETLIEKYNDRLTGLDTSKGVLFLVDTWGGSRLMPPVALLSIKRTMRSSLALTFRCWLKPLWLVMMSRHSLNWLQ